MFLFQSTYEREHDSTPQVIRRQAYWAMTGGACGQVIGSQPVWSFESGWQQGLDSCASRDMARLRRLLDRLPWWQLEPVPYMGALIAGGVGEEMGLDTATAAWTTDRDAVLVYVPTARSIDLDLNTLALHRYIIRTVEPNTGRVGPLRHYRAAGIWRFDPPGVDDWALVIAREDLLGDVEDGIV